MRNTRGSKSARESPVTPTKPDPFRALVEGKISTEQYLRNLKERVEELRESDPPKNPEAPQPA
jgi:hypothetical protein